MYIKNNNQSVPGLYLQHELIFIHNIITKIRANHQYPVSYSIRKLISPDYPHLPLHRPYPAMTGNSPDHKNAPHNHRPLRI